jgi:hypothetical protein
LPCNAGSRSGDWSCDRGSAVTVFLPQRDGRRSVPVLHASKAANRDGSPATSCLYLIARFDLASLQGASPRVDISRGQNPGLNPEAHFRGKELSQTLLILVPFRSHWDQLLTYDLIYETGLASSAPVCQQTVEVSESHCCKDTVETIYTTRSRGVYSPWLNAIPGKGSSETWTRKEPAPGDRRSISRPRFRRRRRIPR